MNTEKRTTLKTLGWRALASVDIFIIAYLATGKPAIAAAITGLEIFTRVTLYSFSRRAKDKAPTQKPVDSMAILRRRAA